MPPVMTTNASPELLHGPALAVGSAEEEGVPRLLGENHVGDLPTERMVNSSHPSPGGHGDGCLADLGDGKLHKLAVLRPGAAGHPEGPLVLALVLHREDGAGLGAGQGLCKFVMPLTCLPAPGRHGCPPRRRSSC